MKAFALTRPSQAALTNGFIAIFIACISIYYFAGLPAVPFHPDESTQIFNSNDFTLFFTHPASLFWQPNLEGNIQQHYREIDAPLTRDLIGIGLLISGNQPLGVDWNWSKTWDENVQAGALPSPAQLLASRIAVAGLFPFTLVLIFLIGKKLKGTPFGVILTLLFACNALILLHTRRAMAESALIFGVSLTIWGILNSEKRPWIAMIGAAIAFNSKQSTLALAPVVLLAVCWAYVHPLSIKPLLIRAGLFLAVFGGITLLLNPFLYSNPIRAMQAAFRERQDFISQQVKTLQTIAPEQILNSPGERFVALTAQLYILPAAVEDVGNYDQAIGPSKTDYYRNPGTSLFRNFAWGGIFIALTLTGIILALLKIIRNGIGREKWMVLLLSGYLLQILVLILTIPIPYQRYWVPLIPFTCLWILMALFELFNAIYPRLISLFRKSAR